MANPKGKRGGARPGAGRPSGFDKEQARLRLRALVSAHLDEMVEAQLANAKGIKFLMVREGKTGKFKRVAKEGAEKLNPDEEIIEVWEKDPSVQAFTDLLNRTIDKPAETVNAEVDHKGELTFRWVK